MKADVMKIERKETELREVSGIIPGISGICQVGCGE